MDIVIGMDIGGTKTHAAAFDRSARLLAEVLIRTDRRGPDAVGELIAGTLVDLIGQVGERTDRIGGVGIGVPGLVDRAAGRVRHAVNLGIGDAGLDIASTVDSVSPAPCHVDNDVNVAAMGAHELLGPDCGDLVYLSIGTGIAAGVILDGRLHRGATGVAGEIGHAPIADSGPKCACGLHGCLEAIASGAAIGRRWPAAEGLSPTGSLLTAAGRGDRRARALVDTITDHLATAIYLLTIAYDAGTIVVGGGVADVGRPLLDEILGGLGRLERRSRFVRSLDLPGRVVLKPPGPVGTVGAAALAAGAGR